MNRYIRIFKRFFLLNLSQFLVYRANFVNSLVSDVVWGIFTIVSMLFITTRVSNIAGWSKNELLLLSSSFNMLLGIYFFFFSKTFWRFSETVHFGKLDTILLKPIDSQFFLSTQYSNVTKSIRVIGSIILNIYLLYIMHIQVTLMNVFGFILLILTGLVILYSISYIAASLLLWNSNLSNLMGLVWDFLAISRYPKEIFQELNTYVFLFLLPVSLTVSTPTKVLLQKTVTGESMTLILIAACLFIIARLFWQFALRFYTSANI